MIKNDPNRPNLLHITTCRNLVDEKELLTKHLLRLKEKAIAYFNKEGTKLYYKVWWGENLVDPSTKQSFGTIFFTAKDRRKIGKHGYEFSFHVKQNENTTVANNFSSTSVRAFQNNIEDVTRDINIDSVHFFMYNDGAFESILYLKSMLETASPLLDKFNLNDKNLLAYSHINHECFINDEELYHAYNPDTVTYD